MSISQEFINFVVEQLRDFGPVTPKKMFGGAGLYHKGTFFGLIAEDVLYFKVDDSNRSDYTEKGSKPFQPYQDKPYTMSYFEVPVDFLEDRCKLSKWAEKAYAVALKGKAKKKK